MKIRNGFVSNSSSSSFMIYGIALDETEETLKAILKKIVGKDTIKGWKDQEDPIDDIEDTYELGEAIACELGMSWHGNGDYGYWIGKSWDEIGDNETGAEFKAHITETLKGAFGDKIRVGTHAESWYS